MKSKRFRPSENEHYYYIDFDTMRVHKSWWSIMDDYSFELWLIHNVFRTKKEAQAKLRQIKKILKEG